jgi:hypothetical protein
MGGRRTRRGDDAIGPERVGLTFGLRIDDDGTAHVIPAGEVPSGTPEVEVDLADVEVVLGDDVVRAMRRSAKQRAGAGRPASGALRLGLPVGGAIVGGVPGFLGGLAASWLLRRRR